jgi:hypothetical protein
LSRNSSIRKEKKRKKEKRNGTKLTVLDPQENNLATHQDTPVNGTLEYKGTVIGEMSKKYCSRVYCLQERKDKGEY